MRSRYNPWTIFALCSNRLLSCIHDL
jgi:hypothetical protein